MMQVMKPVRKRKWPLRLGIVLAVIVSLFAATWFIGRPIVLRMAREELERRIEDLSEQLGRKIIVGELSSAFTEALRIKGIEVSSTLEGQPLLYIEDIKLDLSLWDALMGKRVPGQVSVEGATLVVKLVDGRAPDVEDFLNRVAHRGKGTGRREGSLPDIRISQATIVLFERTEKIGAIGQLDAEIRHVEGGGLEAEFSGEVTGLSAQPVLLRGVGTKSASTGSYLNVELGSDVELTKMLHLPMAFSITGATLEIPPNRERMIIGVKGIRVFDIKEVPEGLRRYVDAIISPITADEVGIEVSKDMFVSPRLDHLISMKVRNVSASIRPAKPIQADAKIYGLNADIVRDVGSRNLKFSMEALVDCGGVSRLSGSAEFKNDLTPVDLNVRLSGPFLVRVIAAFHNKLLPWPGSRLDAQVHVSGDGTRYSAKGFLEGQGLAYFWTKLCLVPVHDIAFQADFSAEVDLKKQTLHLELDPIEVSLARMSIGIDLQRFSSTPKVKLRFTIPRQSCQAFFTAVPAVMVPRLQGAVLEGSMAFEIRLAVDLKNPTNATLEVEPDMEDCAAITLGPLVDVQALAGKFTHRIIEEDYDEPILTGPATSKYVPIEEIPIVVQQAALATEDMNFFRHHGFAKGLIKRAISLNLDKGWYVYGGSTISQQLVKNLFLSREKTLARKLEEAVIVWQMERTIPKERILEIYLNVVEFGKHIYGIKDAANVYFDKEPKELNALEAAWIMATKPSPRYAYNVYRRRQFNEWWVQRMEGILRRLWSEMGVIDEATYRSFAPYVPIFWYGDDGIYARPTVASSSAVPPGMPAELPKVEQKPPEQGRETTDTQDVQQQNDTTAIPPPPPSP